MWYSLAFTVGWFGSMLFTWIYDTFVTEHTYNKGQKERILQTGKSLGALRELNKHSTFKVDVDKLEAQVRESMGIPNNE